MNDNLPEINFKEKKEKKRGVLGWLKNRLGLGTRGAIEEAGINPSAMNVGRALGGAKFGASTGLAGLLAGKAGLIATFAIIATAGGMYMVRNAPAPTMGNSAFSSSKTPDNYVPAILRNQSANQGSSLDMFKETNKGAVALEEDASKAAAKPADAKPASGEEAKNPDANQPPVPDAGNMAQSMMGKLQGGDLSSLTSSLGGGSNKFSGMGGFGNKFNSGATGGKAGFTAGIGSGFQSMPKFDQRKSKMMAMKGSARPVLSSTKGGKSAKAGPGAFNQANALNKTQRSYTGSNIDSARSTQDKAWEGSTGEGGTSATGAGISDGGAGIVTSPSIDNGSGSTGGGSVGDTNAGVPDTGTPTEDSPWSGQPQMAMQLILLSAILSAIGAWIISIAQGPLAWLKFVGYALCIIAMGLALAAIAIGIKLMFTHGQAMLGTIYTIGGGLALVGAIMAFQGNPGQAMNTNVLWMAGIAGILSMMGSMFSSK
jgi:hypothetical protein